VGVTNVWVQTHSDGLVRADQIVGIEAHRTPALTGKPANWLLDVVVPSTVSGAGTGAGITMLHRTLIQTSQDPADAPVMLARLLAQLDAINAAGVIVASRGQFGRQGAVPDARGEQSSGDVAVESGVVRFQFTPFPTPPPGHHTGTEYL
jgi:hypothetical protein